MANLSSDDLVAEVKALRADLAAMRLEQREMAQAIDQMTQTFRTLATHLGIAAEPYRRGEAKSDRRETPGFA
ncbi:MAG: hypothetical protein L3K19_08755 [Thermoplasmata archaeon]|nr:hypothetical protein [Thermoplasmata archaeon]